MLNNNFIALLLTFLAAQAWLQLNNYAAARKMIGVKLSRKLIHIGTGPIFIISWLLFDKSVESRYLAALVPLAITLKFALIGFGIIKDETTVNAITRTGDHKDLLRGPLYYGVIFIAITIVYWLDSPIGIIALMLLCGGDGLADIVGSRWGRFHLPWAPDKTLLGSAGMFVGGWTLSLVMVSFLIGQGALPGEYSEYVFSINLIAVAATAVESLPFRDIDNFTVTLTAVFYGNILFF